MKKKFIPPKKRNPFHEDLRRLHPRVVDNSKKRKKDKLKKEIEEAMVENESDFDEYDNYDRD